MQVVKIEGFQGSKIIQLSQILYCVRDPPDSYQGAFIPV